MSECHSHSEDAGTDTAVVGYLVANDRTAYSIHNKPDVCFDTTNFDVSFIGSQYFAGCVIIVIDKWLNTDGGCFAVVGYLLM